MSILGLSKYKIDERLSEIDYGKLDGKTLDFLQMHYPELSVAWGKKEDPNFPDGENTQSVFDRLNSFIESQKKEPVKGNVLVCTHTVVLRCLIGDALGLPKSSWHTLVIPHLIPLECILTDDGKLFLNLELAHLKQILQIPI